MRGGILNLVLTRAENEKNLTFKIHKIVFYKSIQMGNIRSSQNELR